MNNFETIIRSHIIFEKESPSGWNQYRCPLCNDHSPRAGIKFDAGGGIYGNCFNCGHKWQIEINDFNLGKNAKMALSAIGVPINQMDTIFGQRILSNKGVATKVTEVTSAIVIPPSVSLPPESRPLTTNTKDERILVDYLAKRRVDYQHINAHYSPHPSMRGRVILPCLRNNTPIFWQARLVIGAGPRYKSCPAIKDGVIWGWDNLMRTRGKLWITEGIFDAWYVGGIAIMGSNISESIAALINSRNVQPILIVDRDSAGSVAAKKAISLGWSLSWVDEAFNDVGTSVEQAGQAWTAYTLHKNITKTPVGESTTLSEIKLALQMASARLNK